METIGRVCLRTHDETIHSRQWQGKERFQENVLHSGQCLCQNPARGDHPVVRHSNSNRVRGSWGSGQNQPRIRSAAGHTDMAPASLRRLPRSAFSLTGRGMAADGACSGSKIMLHYGHCSTAVREGRVSSQVQWRDLQAIVREKSTV